MIAASPSLPVIVCRLVSSHQETCAIILQSNVLGQRSSVQHFIATTACSWLPSVNKLNKITGQPPVISSLQGECFSCTVTEPSDQEKQFTLWILYFLNTEKQTKWGYLANSSQFDNACNFGNQLIGVTIWFEGCQTLVSLPFFIDSIK